MWPFCLCNDQQKLQQRPCHSHLGQVYAEQPGENNLCTPNCDNRFAILEEVQQLQITTEANQSAAHKEFLTSGCVQNAEPLPALSPEQQRVVDLVVSGKSVFFTGCAGGSAACICKQQLDTAAAELLSLYHTFYTVLYGCLCSTFLNLHGCRHERSPKVGTWLP